MCKIGFTGTKVGMTFNQRLGVHVHLAKLFEHGGVNEFHHGLCVGADCEAATIAKKFKFKVVAYPGFPANNPQNLRYRGSFKENDIVMPEEEFLERNRKIVNASSIMIATPRENYEALRSGTWAAIRYAGKKGKPMIVILPNGHVEEYNRNEVK